MLPCAIIRGVNERRQRVARPLVAGLVVLGTLGAGSGCDAGAQVGSAQTAIVVAQTAVGVAQTALPGLQTSLPGIQATAQAGATQVAAVLSDPQAINAQLQFVLAGATIEPADASQCRQCRGHGARYYGHRHAQYPDPAGLGHAPGNG